MCEIAIINPEEDSPENIAEFCKGIYQSQRDSLGLVGVVDEGDQFSYEILKKVEPPVNEVTEFVQRMQENDDVHRMVIHGRLATHGEVIEEHAHPLEIDCPECNVQYVVHNGIIRGHEHQKELHEKNGHEYNTEVDSEVIAHVAEEVPQDFDHDLGRLLTYQPAYLLLGKERMFTSTGGGYHLNGNGYMSTQRRPYGPDVTDDKYKEVLYTPQE